MRLWLSTILLGSLAVWGCSPKKPPAPPPAARTAPGTLAPTSATQKHPTGRVTRVHTEGRFVVLNFTLEQLPAQDQRLNLYRHGVKVGEVKVTGQQRDDNVIADIITGDAEVGDEARAD